MEDTPICDLNGPGLGGPIGAILGPGGAALGAVVGAAIGTFTGKQVADACLTPDSRSKK